MGRAEKTATLLCENWEAKVIQIRAWTKYARVTVDLWPLQPSKASLKR
jgi:hypothetical protein